MSDVCDASDHFVQLEITTQIAAASHDFEEGSPGICIECGFDSPRLIHDTCATCRDEAARYTRRTGRPY